MTNEQLVTANPQSQNNDAQTAQIPKYQPPDPDRLQECNKCKAAGFMEELIGFVKGDTDPVTGKIKWILIDPKGNEHQHKGSAASGKTFVKRSIYGLAGIQSGPLEKINQWLHEGKSKTGGYFEILGEGYFSPDGERWFDLIWKHKIE